MSDFTLKGDWLDKLGGFDLLGPSDPEDPNYPPWKDDQEKDLKKLTQYAKEERADALGEIASQHGEFVSDFLHLVSANSVSHPATFRLLAVAIDLTALMTLQFKAHFDRPRPEQLLPGLFPPIPHTGHASYPSGHATQAHVLASLLTQVTRSALSGNVADMLTAFAERVSRNREIAGLHYPSDTAAGKKLAKEIVRLLAPAAALAGQPPVDGPYLPRFQRLIDAAKNEWPAPAA